MNIISKTDKMTGSLEQVETTSTSIIGPFIQKLPIISQEIIVALVPILLVFLVFQKISFKMSKKAVRKILIGLLFTFIGLVLFLVSV